MDEELSAGVRRELPPGVAWQRPIVRKGGVWFGELGKCPRPWSCWNEGEA